MQERLIITLLALAVTCALGTLVAEAVPAPAPLAEGWLAPGSILQRLNDRLELSDDQVTDIRGTLAARGPEVAADLVAVKTARLELFDAIHQHPSSEEAVLSAAAQLAGAEAELALQRAEIVTGVYDVLTPDQQAELERIEQEAKTLVESVASVLMAAVRTRLGT